MNKIGNPRFFRSHILAEETGNNTWTNMSLQIEWGVGRGLDAISKKCQQQSFVKLIKGGFFKKVMFKVYINMEKRTAIRMIAPVEAEE